MTIETLIKAVPPPAKPTYAFDEPWDTIQSQLTLQMPIDYKELVRLYGSGRFFEFFDIYAPRSPIASCRLIDAIQAVRSLFLQEVQGGSFIFDDPPLPLWPRPGGLLACGRTAWGDYLFWLTRGLPSEWPVVLWDRYQGQLTLFEYDLSDFLAGITNRTIGHDRIPGPTDGPAFQSASDLPPDDEE